MNGKLILGPAASGKTAGCIERIHACRQQTALGLIWVVLPNRAQVVSFRRRFASRGGGFGVRIETMSAFVEEITIRLGCQRPRATAPVRRRMVQAALDELADAGELPHYGSIAGKAGLSNLLSERFLEIKRAGWTRDPLSEKLAATDQPLPELARIFDRYESRLEDLGWEDEEGLARLAATELLKQPAVMRDLALVVLDGFDSFTSNQLDLLEVLEKINCELLITLPFNAAEGQVIYPRFQKSVDDLTDRIPSLEITRQYQNHFDDEAIVHLANGLNKDHVSQLEHSAHSLKLVKAHSINAEVREGLRWLKSVTIRQGIPIEDCALILADPESYEPTVREVAEEYGIPLRFGLGRQLHKAPAIAALLDILRLPMAGWPRRLTLEAIRSPFFNLSDFDLSMDDAKNLEAASYWGQVVQGIDQWLETLDGLAKRKIGSGQEDEEVAASPLPSLDQASRLHTAMYALHRRLDPGPAKPLSAWVRWLEDLLHELSFFESVSTKQEQAAGLRLRELLRALLLSEKVMGSLDVSYSSFLSELESLAEGARFQPKPEWSQAALQVEGVEAIRGLRFQAIALLGLSEGQLPAVEREDPLLDEATRKLLHLEPRIGRDQRALFYSAITRADKLLLLSRPAMADDGEEWQPSPYWRQCLELFGLKDEQVESIRLGQLRPMAEAGSPQEVSFLAVKRGSLPRALSSLEERLKPLRRAKPLIHARLAEEPAGKFEGDLDTLSSRFSDLLGPDHLWSPSRLESYGTCPHYYLTSQLLNLELLQEPTLGPDARQLGSLLHEILELSYKSAGDPSDAEDVISRMKKIAAERFAAAPDQYGFRPSPLWHVDVEQLSDSLEDSIRGLAEQGEGWQPSAYEATFGLGENPALLLETDQGRILVRGVVDRLDRKGSELRVIDYKTGGSLLARADFLNGRRLQLPLYALAAEYSLKAGKVSAGFYWNIRGSKKGSLQLESFKATWDGEHVEGVAGSYQVLRDHLSRFIKGMRTGSYKPVSPKGGCPSYCPAADWCWRFEPGYRP